MESPGMSLLSGTGWKIRMYSRDDITLHDTLQAGTFMVTSTSFPLWVLEKQQLMNMHNNSCVLMPTFMDSLPIWKPEWKHQRTEVELFLNQFSRLTTMCSTNSSYRMFHLLFKCEKLSKAWTRHYRAAHKCSVVNLWSIVRDKQDHQFCDSVL